MPISENTESLSKKILEGRTDALSKGITLIESSLREDKILARALLEQCLPHSGNSLRLAISGVPGVGKSTFINAIGQEFIRLGHKVAVLAIDPSSERSGGSILGDKTRMMELSSNDMAFIRPSPTSGTLGGVARNTHESILLCEAAGFDLIMVETVGVGQSETSVAHLVDLFILLVLSGAGDELQGIKRGIMEQADLLIVNKSDSTGEKQMNNAMLDLKNALHLFPPNEKGLEVSVKHCSSVSGDQIHEIAEHILLLRKELQSDSRFEKLRSKRSIDLMHEVMDQRILDEIRERIPKKTITEMEEKLRSGEITSYQAVDALITSALSTT